MAETLVQEQSRANPPFLVNISNRPRVHCDSSEFLFSALFLTLINVFKNYLYNIFLEKFC